MSSNPQPGRTPEGYIAVSPLMLARRYLGTHEGVGPNHNPQIQAWLQLASGGLNAPAMPDEVAWCSAFVHAFAYELDLPRPARPALRARHWLTVGTPIPLERAASGFDLVVLQRGQGDQPGPDVLEAPGHVGFWAGWADTNQVYVLGGNQGDSVSIARFATSAVLGVRRL